MISIENIKSIIKQIGFTAENGRDGVYVKYYGNHGNYIIRVNFNTQKIEYRADDIDESNGINWGDSTTCNFEKSENFVVLECVDRLLVKGYPPKSITLEKKYPLGRQLKGKLDIVVTDDNDKAYLMIECKTWGNEFTKEHKKMLKDGGQLFSYYSLDRSAKYLCLYASRYVEDNIDYKSEIIPVDELWLELSNTKEIFDHWNKNFKDNGIFEEWINAYDVDIKALVRGRLQPITKDDSGKIFNQFAEILRHNVVSDKPNAFNKILNLFICKIIDEDRNDEEQVEFQWLEDDTDQSLQLRLNDLYKKGMHKFLNIDVTDYTEKDIDDNLINLADDDAKKALQQMFVKLRLQKNPEFAFIEVYDDASFKLNARVVREVVELLQPYRFRYGHKQQFLGDFFEKLLNTSMKQEAGQFFTPTPVAHYIISCLPIKEFIIDKLKNGSSDGILPAAIDFACGTGHFLTEYMDTVQNIIEGIDTKIARPTDRKKLNYWCGDDGKYEWAGEYVYGIDADYRLIKSSKVSSFLNGDGEANIIRANGLDHFKKSKEYKSKLTVVTSEDSKDNAQFDILIANPPYSVNAFKSTVQYGEESFELFNKLTDNSSEIECLFIERMKQLLKVGGYAGIILPSSILSNTGIYTSAREILLKYFYIVGITEFGPNTFMATNTNTVTLFLKRRDNSDWKKIESAISNFFDKPKDVTVLGIEKAFSKYVSSVYEGLTIEDYISFVNKKPSEVFKAQDIYKDYLKWFESLTDVNNLKSKASFKALSTAEQIAKLNSLFYDKVFTIEKEKLLYFLLTYPQKTVIVKTGEKQAEKEFLGYTFSNTRGHEGINVSPYGSKLYDVSLNSKKANYYTYNAFIGEYPLIDFEMANNISVVNISNLINYKACVFEKTIQLTERSDIKWSIPTNKLGLMCDIKIGGTPDRSVAEYYKDGNNIWVSVAELNSNTIVDSKEKITDLGVNKSNVKLVPKGTTLLSFKLSIGKTAIAGTDLYTNEAIAALVIKDEYTHLLADKYLFVLFSSGKINLDCIGSKAFGKSLNLKDLNDIVVPLPSISEQSKIIASFETLDNKTKEYRNQIDSLKNKINSFISDIEENNNDKTKIKKVATINPSKLNKNAYKLSHSISFIDMASVSENGYICKQEIRDFGSVVSESYKCFLENDIIIAKITPCMENGKCALATNLTNGIGFGSTEFHVIRADNTKILPKFLFLLLNREKIREEAKLRMTGKSGHRRVPEVYYSDLDIVNVDIETQKEIVAQVEILEKEIQTLESKIVIAEEQKKTILNKYLFE